MFNESIRGLASTKLSPLIITLLLNNSSSPVSINLSFSVPKDSFELLDSSLNARSAVLPNKDLILSGLSRPGSSSKILSLPLFKIFGSLVPTSSTLFRTISIA